MSENGLMPINGLIKKKFIIPAYQRGYRWDRQQVTDLLEDIWEFIVHPPKHKEDEISPFYCLQPIVVKQKNDIENEWEVIDGQQRLTTIFLLLYYFNQRLADDYKKELFDLRYETRPNSDKIISEIGKSNNLNGSNIDYHYMSNAYEVVKQWFAKQQHIVEDFESALLNRVKIIWYELEDIEDHDAAKIFARINTGKIPLTNSELIKAQFLRRDHSANEEEVRLKQLKIAGEWDRMEQALQNDEFWYFIHDAENEPSNRIDYIFELMYPPEEEEFKGDYATFYTFNKKFDCEENTIEEKWGEVKKYYSTFEEWYHDKYLYHLIGFLIATGTKIEEIKKASEGKSKTKFKKWLRDEIKNEILPNGDKAKKFEEQIRELLRKLQYGEDNNLIQKVLLLFNIITIQEIPDSSFRFPFNRYKKNKWTIEHIHAQNSEKLKTEKQWKGWIEEQRKSLERLQSYKDGVQALIDPLTNSKVAEKDRISKFLEEVQALSSELTILGKGTITKDQYETVFKKVKNFFQDEEDDAMHGIGNLALADHETNSALNNSIFEVKRHIIIKRDKQGEYIPICTRNVFLKYYSENVEQFYFWSAKDRQKYTQAIIEKLQKFLEGENNE